MYYEILVKHEYPWESASIAEIVITIDEEADTDGQEFIITEHTDDHFLGHDWVEDQYEPAVGEKFDVVCRRQLASNQEAYGIARQIAEVYGLLRIGCEVDTKFVVHFNYSCYQATNVFYN